MDYKLFSFVLFSFVLSVSCRNLGNAENATSELNVTEGSWRQGRSQSNLVYVNLFSCAVRYDASCFVDAAGELFEIRKNELLAQADLEAFKVTGRADPENSPSQLAKTIEQLISELSGLFKEGIANFFSGKEADDEDEIVDADDKNDTSSRDVGESREKKKKKKKPLKSLIAIIKIGILAAVVVAKITVLVKLFEAALKFKFLLIAGGSFIINAVKFYFDLKAQKSHQHQEENIVYRNPYEHGGDWNSGGPGEYNARAYDMQKELAQSLAFSAHKPA